MNYEQFKQCILSILREKYPEEEYAIDIRQITKNNGICLDGLCIFRLDDMISPTIYLKQYYDHYQCGASLADIVYNITREYEQGLFLKPAIPDVDAYYEAVRSQIIMRLVNFEKNKEILEECPHIKFHDLAITFRWLAFQDEIGISSALISNHELERWGISLEQMYEDAKQNTERLFPGKIAKLKDVIEDSGLIPESKELELYLLTNEQGLNGATCILYHQILKEFARKHKSSFYLLPSSIHEMILCFDCDEVSVDMLLALVKEANHTVVTMGEVLSDNIYFYDYKNNSISMISNNINSI